MIAAKPGRVMPAPTLQSAPRTESATSAASVSNPYSTERAAIDETQSLRSAPIPAGELGRERSTNEHADNPESPLNPEIEMPGFPREMGSPATSLAPIRNAEVMQTMTHIQRATEQLRVSGRDRVELGVTLDSGHQLTIQLRMTNGEVTPIIRTESEPLRIALEQNWVLFSQRGGEGDLRITTPVFESPQTSSNMSDLNQQRDQRQRAFNEPAHESFQPPFQRRNTPSNPRPSPAAPPPTSGVRLYA